MMDIVNKYIKSNNQKFVATFNSMGSQGELEATKVFSFFHNIFPHTEIIFIKNGKSFFLDDENS